MTCCVKRRRQIFFLGTLRERVKIGTKHQGQKIKPC
jgi:hypothetical protein